MVNLEEIERTILDLEKKDTTYAVCERLAWLYIVKDHITGQPTTRGALPDMQESEFLRVASGKPVEGVMRIMDEHMQAIKLVYPIEYSKIIQMIKDI